MINISVNGESKYVNSLYLNEILLELGFGVDGFAVALDGEFVPRPTYQKVTLEEGSKLDVVRPIAGG